MTRSGFRKRIYFSFLPSVPGSFSTHPRSRRRNSYETVLLSCGLLLYGIHSSRRQLHFIITYLPSLRGFLSYECFLMSVTSLLLIWTLLELRLFRCKSQVLDVILFVPILPYPSRFIYSCPMVNVDNFSSFSHSWLREVYLVVSLDTTNRGL
jgi:hypothetical protein